MGATFKWNSVSLIRNRLSISVIKSSCILIFSGMNIKSNESKWCLGRGAEQEESKAITWAFLWPIRSLTFRWHRNDIEALGKWANKMSWIFSTWRKRMLFHPVVKLGILLKMMALKKKNEPFNNKRQLWHWQIYVFLFKLKDQRWV